MPNRPEERRTMREGPAETRERGRFPRPVAFAALGLLLACSPLWGSELLPDFEARAGGARYLPADRDFEWVGWVGAGVTLLRARETSLDFDADVETILGNERRGFDANQANYHLELAASRAWRGAELALFLHHVSRHAIDRDKPDVRNWNVLGLRLRRPLPAGLGLPGRVTLSMGPALDSFELGYRWEVVSAVELEVLRRGWGQLYTNGMLRGVGARATPQFPREGFLEALVEAGARLQRPRRALEVYVALEGRNDASLFGPDGRTGARIGWRFALESVGH